METILGKFRQNVVSVQGGHVVSVEVGKVLSVKVGHVVCVEVGHVVCVEVCRGGSCTLFRGVFFSYCILIQNICIPQQ